VFLGLAGILVCSFLGGMRAVTWTQVAQYIILIIAYLIPVVWLSVKHTGIPLPQLVYGSVLQKVTEREKQLTADPKEKEVRDIFRQRAADAKARVDGLPGTWTAGREAAEKRVADLKAANAPMAEQKAAEKALADYPKTEADARRIWSGQIGSNNARAAPPLPHGEPFYSANPDPAKAEAERDRKRKNFLALVLCLMVGTAALPHRKVSLRNSIRSQPRPGSSLNTTNSPPIRRGPRCSTSSRPTPTACAAACRAATRTSSPSTRTRCARSNAASPPPSPTAAPTSIPRKPRPTACPPTTRRTSR
jgi:hypothetical protein